MRASGDDCVANISQAWGGFIFFFEKKSTQYNNALKFLQPVSLVLGKFMPTCLLVGGSLQIRCFMFLGALENVMSILLFCQVRDYCAPPKYCKVGNSS